MAISRRPETCAWCGREVPLSPSGRRRRYCRQSCRQRAYEQRLLAKGASIPADSVILSPAEAEAMADRLFELRCAAEDVVTALNEGATYDEVSGMCQALLVLSREAERLR